MMLWLVMALMTAAAIFAVLWPLSRREPLQAGSDVAVYRDQLDEIERDRAAGLIGDREAEAARIEVSRRLLAAADVDAPAPGKSAGARRRAVAVVALLLLPLGAAGLYLTFGSPDLPSQPLATRRDAPPEQRSIADLVGRVEAHLEQNPEDGRGWEVIGPVYMRLGRYDDAVKARRNALRLLGPTAVREADLGEALTGAANGIVTAEAKGAFDRALVLDPEDFRARYFSGLAAEQDGRPKDAADIWKKLLAGAPEDAAWIGFVRESLLRVDPNATVPQARPNVASPDAPKDTPGPSAADVAAANEMSPDQRDTMVRGMVARLAERLKQDGSDVDGWLRLLRAYMVLGDKEQARASASDARRALEGNADGLKRLDEAIKGLGLEG
jgi:cytochrome c-type biogenesis protein CcmH